MFYLCSIRQVSGAFRLCSIHYRVVTKLCTLSTLRSLDGDAYNGDSLELGTYYSH